MSDARLLLLLLSPPSPSSSPDLICQLLIAVVLAGPDLPALDRSGPRRTSTGESRSAVGLAGPQPARFGVGPRRTSTGEILRAGPRLTSTAPQRPQTKPYRMPKKDAR